jgi:uncharacterized protein (DUF849 family)
VEMHSSSLSTCARTPIDQERPALVCRMRAMCHTGREPRPSDSIFIRLALANVRGANMNELRDEFCAWWRCSLQRRWRPRRLRTTSERQRHRAHDEKPHRRREEIPVFDKAVSKSTIRKTSREKDAKAFAQRLQNDTEAMLRQFQNSKKAGARYQSSCKAPATSSE